MTETAIEPLFTDDQYATFQELQRIYHRAQKHQLVKNDALLIEMLSVLGVSQPMLRAMDLAERTERARTNWEIQACTCVEFCGEDPRTRCSLHGEPHVHPDDGSGVFGPCPVHPDRPGDR